MTPTPDISAQAIDAMIAELKELAACKHDDLSIADDAAAMLAALRDRADGGWLPIESAPKDGTSILFYCDGRVESGKWIPSEPDCPEYMGSDAGWMSDSGYSFPGRSFGNPDFYQDAYGAPTHWMSRPAPPATESPAS